MKYYIEKLSIVDENYSFLNYDEKDNEKKENIIPNLSKVNIFLGPNNSGKSRFLRGLISSTDTICYPNGKTQNELIKLLRNYEPKIRPDIPFSEHLNGIVIGIQKNIIGILNFFVDEKTNAPYKLSTNKYPPGELLEQIKSNRKTQGLSDYKGQRVIKNFEDIDSLLKEIDQNYFGYFPNKRFKIIYIPILRSLRLICPIRCKDKIVNVLETEYERDPDFAKDLDLYKKVEQEDHFKSVTTDIEIFTGLSAYLLVHRFLNGSHKQHKFIKEYEQFLSEKFFDNDIIEIIAKEEESNLTIKIGTETEYPIYQLGDGLQSLIIGTLPLFLYKDENILLFYEEPEHLLHPGFQRKLLEVYLEDSDYNKNNQYFLTTHSNHFLDVAMDNRYISIYSLKKDLDHNSKDPDQKKAQFTIENLSAGDTTALDLLGVNNASVFLSNCSIWVEGVTDRRYYRHYLKIYIEHLRPKVNRPDDNVDSVNYYDLKEDYHYSFIEYGGGNLVHFSFGEEDEKNKAGVPKINTRRITNRIFLIADKDSGKDEKHEKYQKLLYKNYFDLPCREAENLLKREVLLNVINELERVKITDAKFLTGDICNKLLGRYIDKQLKKIGHTSRFNTYAAPSGTIWDKNKFCSAALNNIKNWNDLSESAQELTKKMYEFICEQNH
ncbi:MAG: AAA family ATPase, partial [Candidatus Celaenobacter polaris]|nr:AAA family ATPase [Candidatus Celaenobacter polaris]